MKKTLLAFAVVLVSLAAFSIQSSNAVSQKLTLAQSIDWKEGENIKYCQLKIVKYASGKFDSSYWMFDINSQQILEFNELGSYKKPALDVGRTVLSNCKMIDGKLVVEHSLITNDFVVDNKGISESIMDWTMIGNPVVDQYYGQPYSHEVDNDTWYDFN
jgi:hypothetical protein